MNVSPTWAARVPACTRLSRWWHPGQLGIPLPYWEWITEGLDAAPFNVERFYDRLAEDRGRPIVRVPLAAAGAAQAMWAPGLDTDYILHTAGVSPLHRDLLVLHGIGHMLLDHRGGSTVVDEGLLRTAFGHLSRADARQTFGGVAYDAYEEQQAEAFATWLLRNDPRWTLGLAEDADRCLLVRMSSVLECADRSPGP